MSLKTFSDLALTTSMKPLENFFYMYVHNSFNLKQTMFPILVANTFY